MNKKIKVIELLNEIANGEEVPEKIKIRGNTLKWTDVEGEKGYKVIDKNSIFYWLQDIISLDSIEDLNEEVEILEDNTEEIEEIPQYRIDNCTDYNYCYLAEKYNKLAKAVNQIRKDKNNE